MLRLLLLLMTIATAAAAQTPREADFIARDFRFSTGEVLPEVRLHYATLGDPSHPAVLVLHGTGGSHASMLSAGFAGQLFGPGQPLDASRHFIILPDAIGTGKSAKPSDGLGPRFPRYSYADQVRAQEMVVRQALGVRRLRLVIGNSMGGMHAWLWATMFPDAMDAVVPMAAQPSPMAGRNWMLRRLMVETIRQDPAYAGGNYTQQPPVLRYVATLYATATNGGTLATQAATATTAQANAMVEQRLAAPQNDANDYVWVWDASRDYDPSAALPNIKARVLAILSADDERNPVETGVAQAAVARVPNGRLLVIPASPQTSGHGTTGNARFYAEELRRFLSAGE